MNQETAVNYSKKAKKLQSIGKLFEAEAAYRKAIELKPEFYWYYSQLGQILIQQDKLDEALNTYSHAVEINPNSTYSYYAIGKILEKQNNFSKAIAYYQKAINLKSNVYFFYTSLAEATIQQGNYQKAIEFCSKALEYNSKSSKAYRVIALALDKIGDTDKSLDMYSKAIELEPNLISNYPEIQANIFKNLISLGCKKSHLDKYFQLIKEAAKSSEKYILISCMQKSGSTFLRNLLLELTGYKNFPLVYGYLQNEQELYLSSVINSVKINTVTQQHLRATEPNLQIIQLFDINPIVLVRNIFDIVVSIYDHFHRESVIMPMAYLNDQVFELQDNKIFDLIVDLIIPWYFNFYVSWYVAWSEKKCNMLWVTYEELIRNKTEVLGNIAKFYELDKTNEEIKICIEKTMKTNIRMNKGIVGRGNEFLNGEQKQKIIRLASYYPWVDFSRIGI